MKSILFFILLSFLLMASCSKTTIHKDTSREDYAWQVPIDQLVINENAHDLIPAIDTPYFKPAHQVELPPDEEVLLFRTADQVRIYPISTIWKHEIVNDKSSNNPFTVSYCPLTGSGIAWQRLVNGNETTFGVSGNLYNSNLIPYDRKTETYWSQMTLNGIKGELGGDVLQPLYLLHTIYSSAILAYPNSQVLVDEKSDAGCDSLCVPKSLYVSKDYPGIASKYFGVIIRDEVLLFERGKFTDSMHVFQTSFKGTRLVIAANEDVGFFTAFKSPQTLSMHAIQHQWPVIMSDAEGNTYDIMGVIISGENKGQHLDAPFSYSAKAFAWQLFFENLNYF
ncbi:MAG: DUF3179 domain-containing protein [Bacteroidetes bacterium]|nr:DUF3179 domain-containing protein [Bacteroidota bacterium]MBU1577890.1 DUF3179 domain-containing protein [Bacteroidota bacterium]MBU2466704.1 DUF3179 domain-containing protein [Bacteroidota bacterium]MBU2558476.1 DUF3179 domain-containing protein [Bacteroidota bacterium]